MECPECGGTDLRDMGYLPFGERVVHALDCRSCQASLTEERHLVVVTDPELLRRVGRRQEALARLEAKAR